MIKTQFEIEMNFQKAQRQADQLDQIAKHLRKLADNKLNQVLNSLSNAWQGENSTAFLKKGMLVQTQIEERADSLTKIAATLRQTAKNIHDAELNNLKTATMRNYR